MSIYTISPDFLGNIDEEERNYLSNILFVFANKTNSYKVSKDKNGEILDIYQGIQQNAEIIKTWLDLMSFSPSSFERIDIDISGIDCNETKFIKLCKETKGFNNLIVYSIQNIVNHKCVEKKIKFEDVTVNILDRDDASRELNRSTGDIITYNNSQVATGGSKIIDSKNRQN